MNQILIATHSKLAQGFYEAVKFFNNDVQNVDYLNCYVDDNNVEEELIEKIEKYKDKTLLVMTDIAGGSVNQIAMKLLTKYQFHLVSGINLALLLELAFIEDDFTAEQIQSSVQDAQVQMGYINMEVIQDQSNVEDDLDEL